MSFTIRVFHLVALGLWLGSITFFSFFTALPIIDHMQDLASQENNWAGLRDRDQGTRMAGEALTAVFERYFPFQVACGAVALLTSFAWITRRGFVNRLRVAVIFLGLGLALVNLTILAPRIHQLRQERYSGDERLAVEANRAFGTWHNISLMVDMATLMCAFMGMVCAAGLPESQSSAATPTTGNSVKAS